jgi:hypothetical protein
MNVLSPPPAGICPNCWAVYKAAVHRSEKSALGQRVLLAHRHPRQARRRRLAPIRSRRGRRSVAAVPRSAMRRCQSRRGWWVFDLFGATCAEAPGAEAFVKLSKNL